MLSKRQKYSANEAKHRIKVVGCTLFEILIDKETRAVYTEYQLSTLRDSQKTKHPRFRKTSTQQSFQNFAGADLALSLWRVEKSCCLTLLRPSKRVLGKQD